MRETVVGSAARIAGGFGIVACAAVIALATGGGNFLGGLGGLFGRSGASLDVAKSETPAADILAAPTAAQRAALLQAQSPAPLRTPKRNSSGPHHRQRTGAPPRLTPVPQPSPTPQPSLPSPTPTPVPTPAPSPSPGGGQVVSTVGETVTQVTSQAPPPLQPLTKPINDAVDALVKACQGLPTCP